VKRVEGVSDVRERRLVVHGWFVQPRPFIQGALAPRALQSAIDGMQETLAPLFSCGERLNGVVSLRLEVSAGGNVTLSRILTNTLRAAHPELEGRVLEVLLGYFKGRRFGRQRGKSRVTLPVIFQTGPLRCA
jgi:hypothetical protein